MKDPVRKLDEAHVRRRFPIADRVPGWFFRFGEVSNGVWLAEGTDLWGRTVGETGLDDQLALEGCITAAQKINKSLGTSPT